MTSVKTCVVCGGNCVIPGTPLLALAIDLAMAGHLDQLEPMNIRP